MDTMQAIPLDCAEARIYPQPINSNPSKDFQLLLKYLPNFVIKELDDYHPIVSCFEKEFDFISDLKKLSVIPLSHISKISLLAYRIQKISFERLITIFLRIGAVEELILNPKMTIVLCNTRNSHQSNHRQKLIKVHYLGSS